MREIVNKIFLFVIISTLILPMGCAKKSQPMKAPFFEAKGLDGKIYTLNDYKGKYLFLIFWATWCPTCKKELKNLAANYESLEKAGIKVLLACMDKNPEAVKKTAEDNGFANMPIAIVSDQMMVDYQWVRFLPTGVLIDPSGTIIERFVGELPVEEVIKAVRGQNR